MNDPIVVRCGHCQQRLRVVPREEPSRAKCSQCGTVLMIAGTNPSAAGQVAVRPPTPGVQTSRPPTPASTRPSPPPLLTQPPLAEQTFRGGHVSGSVVKANKQRIPKWVLALIGVALLVPVLCCGAVGILFKTNSQRVQIVPIGVSLRAALPPRDAFPPLGSPQTIDASGVQSYFISFSEPVAIPGRKMQMRVLVPPGEHADRSLPCVLVAPAGTPLLHGVSLEVHSDYDAETLPYAKEGFVVIEYSLDGALPAGIDDSDEGQVMQATARAYPAFSAAGAGVVNGRNALEYAVQRLAFVDPERIYCAGHSSAGNVSLLLAAHEPRISGCVAYAAAYNLESRMQEATQSFVMRQFFPGIEKFVAESSPTTHIEKFHCPVFIFHAVDDSNVPFADAQAFVARMKSASKSVTFQSTPTGDHYESMVNTGIGSAIAWLKQAAL